jgi:Flp pilus assembly CpaF family ATPase
MLNDLMNKSKLYSIEHIEKQGIVSYLPRALYYRSLIYPFLEKFLNPQNQTLEAKELQKQIEDLSLDPLKNTKEALYLNKFLKSRLVETFIDKIFSSPEVYCLKFESSPSVIDRLWTKTLLIHDFFYYGPITILCLSRILKDFENLNSNPIYLLLKREIEDAAISEIRVNNFNEIYYEAHNKIYRWKIPFLNDNQVLSIIQRIINETNILYNASVLINNHSPIADFEHPCGYIRGAAVIPPASHVPCLTLRVHPEKPYSLDDLVSFGMLDPKIKEFLIACQKTGMVLGIAGTMGSGKTTLLSALAESWPDNGRKAIIEDTPELRPEISDVLKFRTIEYEEASRNINLHALTKACKRHSVRYVALSEARDYSAWEILQLSQSILGTLMTFHYTLRSNRFLVDQALNALSALCKQHPLAPHDIEIKYQIASMLQILILIEQDPIDSVRRIKNIYHITGFDELNGGHFKYTELFSYRESGVYELINSSKDLENYFLKKGVNFSFDTY